MANQPKGLDGRLSTSSNRRDLGNRETPLRPIRLSGYARYGKLPVNRPDPLVNQLYVPPFKAADVQYGFDCICHSNAADANAEFLEKSQAIA